MGFAVGVDFGSTKTKVAITKWDNDSGPAAECLRVAAAIPSVVFLGEQNELAIGEHAQKLGATDPHRVIRDFKRRVGDSVPIIADGWSESTESVVAAFVRRIVDEISDEQNATPDLVALAYPAHWGTYKQALIAGALRDAGLAEVLLVTEPAAAITDAALPATGGVETVLVYDFGGGSFDAAVMTRSATGEFRTVGIPQGLDWLGGDDFDQAIFSRVRDGVRLTDTVPADPEILTQMSRLREACTQAKETLSLDTEVTIPVATTRYRTRFRLVRAEFDELIRDAIEDTLDAARARDRLCRTVGSRYRCDRAGGWELADTACRTDDLGRVLVADRGRPPSGGLDRAGRRPARRRVPAGKAGGPAAERRLFKSRSCKSPPSNHPFRRFPRRRIERRLNRHVPGMFAARGSAAFGHRRLQCRPQCGRPSEPTTSTCPRRSPIRTQSGPSFRTRR